MPIYRMRCVECGEELDLFRRVAERERDLPLHCGVRMARKIAAPAVVADAPAYRAVALDRKTGTMPMIEGRAQHREYLKRNGYVEVGNDVPVSRAPLRGEFAVRRELTGVARKVLGK
jgi:hypothetical protein